MDAAGLFSDAVRCHDVRTQDERSLVTSGLFLVSRLGLFPVFSGPFADQGGAPNASGWLV